MNPRGRCTDRRAYVMISLGIGRARGFQHGPASTSSDGDGYAGIEANYASLPFKFPMW